MLRRCMSQYVLTLRASHQERAGRDQDRFRLIRQVLDLRLEQVQMNLGRQRLDVKQLPILCSEEEHRDAPILGVAPHFEEDALASLGDGCVYRITQGQTA